MTEQTEFKARRIELEPFDDGDEDDEVAQSFQQIIDEKEIASLSAAESLVVGERVERAGRRIKFDLVGQFDDQLESGGENRRGNESKRQRANAVRLAASLSALLPVGHRKHAERRARTAHRHWQKQFVLHRFVLREIVEQFKNDPREKSRFSSSNIDDDDDGRMSSWRVALSFVVASLFGVATLLVRQRIFI